jgi:acetoin utilization deacetylase AcuC-like enzyme
MTTGIVYDDIFLKHDLPSHPENAGRLKAAVAYCNRYKLLDPCIPVAARPAREPELLSCHTGEFIESVRRLSQQGSGWIDTDTYVNKHTFDAASIACGSIVDLMSGIVRGRLKNGIALMRPPGHHATVDTAMGFCIFNTIAICAKASLDTGAVKNVAIVDIDVHHGNGTQAIFEHDPSVLYVSTHQYPHYPGTGSAEQTGSGNAIGTKINIPLPRFTGDEDIAELYNKIVNPALYRFHPDMIFVSIGFDAHRDDPLADISLSLMGYDWLVRRLIHAADELCKGRILFSLEGGYNLDVIGPGTGNTIRALLGDKECDDPFTSPEKNERLESIPPLIEKLKRIHGL